MNVGVSVVDSGLNWSRLHSLTLFGPAPRSCGVLTPTIAARKWTSALARSPLLSAAGSAGAAGCPSALGVAPAMGDAMDRSSVGTRLRVRGRVGEWKTCMQENFCEEPVWQLAPLIIEKLETP